MTGTSDDTPTVSKSLEILSLVIMISSSLSVLLRRTIIFLSLTEVRISISSSLICEVESIIYKISSASLAYFLAFSTPIASILSAESLMPAVSIT